MKNYAGSRLSPWLGHLMVSRQETSRPLLTPGEVMQLPPEDEVVLISGCPPLRAKKVRYYEDPQLKARILPSPKIGGAGPAGAAAGVGARTLAPKDDWAGRVVAAPATKDADPDNAGIRREPELPAQEEVAPEPRNHSQEFDLPEDEPDDTPQRAQILQRQVRALARQAALDPGDDLGL